MRSNRPGVVELDDHVELVAAAVAPPVRGAGRDCGLFSGQQDALVVAELEDERCRRCAAASGCARRWPDWCGICGCLAARELVRIEPPRV
jgi:hypothetical protein